jgi:hypothetical protein
MKCSSDDEWREGQLLGAVLAAVLRVTCALSSRVHLTVLSLRVAVWGLFLSQRRKPRLMPSSHEASV